MQLQLGESQKQGYLKEDMLNPIVTKILMTKQMLTMQIKILRQ